MTEYRQYDSIAQVPVMWDLIAANNYHLTRKYLYHAESSQPCQQRYIAFYNEFGKMNGVLLYHRQKVNLLTLAHLPWEFNVSFNCVSPPASVSDPAISITNTSKQRAVDYLSSLNGLTILLNLPADFSDFPGWVRLPLLPVSILPLRWGSFEEYILAQRSSYRRRCRQALQKGAGLIPRRLANKKDSFTSEIYSLYEQVHAHADHKIEKLSKAYFQGDHGDIIVFEDSLRKARGFVQVYKNGDEYIFGFTGMDYTVRDRYDTYFRMLLWLVEDAIRSRCSTLILGQTSEDAKGRLGAHTVQTYLMLRHSNSFIHSLLKLISPCLAPGRAIPAHHVFVDQVHDRGLVRCK